MSTPRPLIEFRRVVSGCVAVVEYNGECWGFYNETARDYWRPDGGMYGKWERENAVGRLAPATRLTSRLLTVDTTFVPTAIQHLWERR